MRSILIGVGGLLVVAGMGALGWFWFVCPCERTPGGPLSGDEHTGIVDDWTFANEVRLCQIEVNRVIPWSVNLNCMADPKGDLYLSCSRCDGKFWSTGALSDPAGRIRIGETVYPISLRRVEDAQTLDVAWQARASKLGRGGAERPAHWWSFQVTSR